MGTPPLELPQQAGEAQHGTMLPLAEVAARLGVSMATVRRRLKAGTLAGATQQAGKHGAEWLVPVATVESLLASDRAQAPTARTEPAHALTAEVERLRGEVERLRIAEAAASAEARALAGQLTELHATMRTLALSAGTQPEPAPAARRWWHRTK